MKKQKLISVLITLSTVLSGINVLAEESLIEKIAASRNGTEIAEILDSDTSGETGLELTDYKKLKYRKYIGNAIYNAPHSTIEEIRESYNAVMSEAVIKKTIDQFSIGAVLNTNGKDVSNDKNGLQFKIGIIRNGYTSGVSGYLIYNEIENPSSIMSITADVRGTNVGGKFSDGSINSRELIITGFTTEDLPAVIENRSALKQYLPDTEEYEAFVDYTDTFEVLENKISIGFEFDSKVTNGVDLSAVVPALNMIDGEKTPLVLKFSDGKQNNSVDFMKLHIAYDMTTEWEKQCITIPADGSSGINNITEFSFNWNESIKVNTWNKNNVLMKIDGKEAEYSLVGETGDVTYIKVDELKDEAEYEIYISGIETEGESLLRDRVIRFTTARSNDAPPVAVITKVDGVKDDCAEIGTVIEADYKYSDGDEDKEDGTVFGWYVSDEAEQGFEIYKAEKSVEPTEELAGKYIRFEVIPANKYATGERCSSKSYRVTLPSEQQSVIDMINKSDMYSIADVISSNSEVLGIEEYNLENMSYLYAGLVNRKYTTIRQFKEAYELLYSSYAPEKVFTSPYGASFNDTGKAQNEGRIYNGLTFVSNPSNGKYGTSAYFWFEADNMRALSNGSFTFEAQQTSGTRQSFVTAFSLTQPPYIGELSEQLPADSEEFGLWADYIANEFTELEEPILVDNEGKAVVTVDIPEQIFSALETAESGAVLVVKFSSPSGGCSNNNIINAKLNAQYDLTKLYQNECETVPENFEKGVNPQNAEYVLTFEDEIHTDEADISLVNTKTGIPVRISTSFSDKKIEIHALQELNTNTLYRVNVKKIKNISDEYISEIIRYFTTDSLMSGIDVIAEPALKTGESSRVGFVGYDEDGNKVIANTAELSSSAPEVIEAGEELLTSKRRGTAVITAVYNNFDGTKTEKKLFAVAGNVIDTEDFDGYAGADSTFAYNGNKSYKAEEKTVLREGVSGNIVVYFYDDMTSSGGVYFEKTEMSSFAGISGESYTGGTKRSKGWHQIFADADAKKVYIDGVFAVNADFDKISIEGLRFDAFAEVDIKGTVCTASSVTIRGANASLTSAYEGAVLTGSYSYSDADGDKEEGTVKEWFKTSSGGNIRIGEGETFNTSGHIGETIVFAVTPKNIYEEGSRKFSSGIQVTAKSTGSGNGGGGGGGGGSHSITTQSSIPDFSVDYSKSEQKPSVESVFADISSEHWAYTDVAALKAAGIISGRENNTFCPDESITRAEFVKLLVYALGISESEYNGEFHDVTADSWYAGVVKAAVENGIVTGYGDGSFGPDRNVTREEMTKLVCAAAELETKENPSKLFDDDGFISSWAKGYVYSAAEAGLINGMENNVFEPMSNATRAQAAVIISRLINSKEAGI